MKPTTSVYNHVTQDRELMDELMSLSKDTFQEYAELMADSGISTNYREFRACIEGKAITPDSQIMTEAIVLVRGRPSLLVNNDEFEEPNLEFWKSRLAPFRESLKPKIQAVGRIELQNHTTFDWVGTGWVIGERLIATNRHVALEFARQRGQGFVFRQNEFGDTISARIDFKEEFQSANSSEFNVSRVLYIAPDAPNQPDMAILELADSTSTPKPLILARNSLIDTPIAVIGYPARDSRNGADAMRDIFKDIFEVKRFAPGMLMPGRDAISLQHDASTLGGNSGSAVIDVASGEVVGLHFGGRFRVGNFAVNVETIRSVLSQLPSTRSIFTPSGDPEGPTAASLATREGYKAEFLGQGRRVRLPILSAAQEEDAVPVPGRDDFVLTYTHFSLAMSQSRRLCYYTAVNIDGNQSINLRRTGNWGFDPRIPTSSQTGNDLYLHNKLDRGHMVRRLDPVWGSNAIAKQANHDTFMYTNSCPQHETLNQGNWNDLEDYILNNADERNLKISVFTGPVFRTDDPVYREVKIPQSFWKVVVMVKANGQLSATGYMLSQESLMDDLEAPGFEYGAFRTYQVPIRTIEGKTELSFGSLSTFDPLGSTESLKTVLEIQSSNDLVL